MDPVAGGQKARGRARTPPPTTPLDYERDCWARGLTTVAGMDEVGRGPLAGPVVASVVVLEEGTAIPGATDSKLLEPAEREALAREILTRARAVGIGASSPREIDRINILQATCTAMNRAMAQARRRLGTAPSRVVVDGLPLKTVDWPHDAVVGGDRAVHSIACASIVAKVCRDRLMRQLARRYPAYGWDHNAGYATPDHRAAIRELGPTPHHRMTFGLLQLSLDL